MDVVTIDNKKMKSPFTDVDEDGNIMTMLLNLSEIDNYNFEGMCSEEKCSAKYTKVFYMTVNGVELMIPICDKHAEEMDEFTTKYNLSLIKRGL